MIVGASRDLRAMKRTRGAPWAGLLVIALGAGGLACDVNDHANRAAWLHATLVADRYGDLRRAPELVEAQFDRMEGDVYLFMRGTLPQFRRDLAEPFFADTRTDFLTRASSLIQLVGDPHIENIGTYPTRSGALEVEFNDFDSAIYGPYHVDVWRLALSWYALGAASRFTRTDERDWLDAAEQVAQGYADEIAAMSAGDDAPLLSESLIVQDLLDEAQDDGEQLAILEAFTAVNDSGTRAFRFDQEDLAPLSRETAEWIEYSIEPWRLILPNQGRELGAFKGATRRLGAGVASLFLDRYYLLFEGRSDDPDDDLLIEWKETRDPCLIATGLAEAARLFPSNAERITVLQRRAHADANSDEFAGWLGQEPWSFRSRRNSGFHQGMDRSRIVRRLRDGRFTARDLRDGAYATGQLLARSHTRPEALDGGSSLVAVAGALSGRGAEFAQEARERISVLGPQLLEDFRLFALLRAQHGPRLDTQ